MSSSGSGARSKVTQLATEANPREPAPKATLLEFKSADPERKSVVAPEIDARRRSANYIAPLTGIRALAAFLVLTLHASQNIPAAAILSLPFLQRGYLGVDLFFVLSGFIITHVYLQALARPSPRAVAIFFWHRFIRLYPVHVTVLACLVPAFLVANATGIHLNYAASWHARDLLWQLSLLHAWGVTDVLGWNAPSWSISAEWFAYLLFPLMAPGLMLVNRTGAALALSAAALLATAGGFALAGWSVDTWMGGAALARVTGEFTCGAALCRAIATSATQDWRFADLLGLGGFAAFLVGASLGLPDFLLVSLLALTILGTSRSNRYWGSLLKSRPVEWLGQISYSIYMVHFPILIIVRRLLTICGFDQWSPSVQFLTFLACVCLVIAASAMMYYLVENPVRRRLRDVFGKAF